MKKLCFTALLIVIFSSGLLGQSVNSWSFNIDALLINNQSYNAGGNNSDFWIELSINNGSWIRVLTTTTPVQRYGGTNLQQVGPRNYSLSQRVNSIHVYTKFDRSGGSDPNTGTWNQVTFQTTTEKIKYRHTTYTAAQVYKTYGGQFDVYAYPKNIQITLRSDVAKGISADDKVSIEGPSGYDASVYKWVYRTSPYESWKSIYNTSLNGNNILEANLADIYGPNFMNDGVVNFSSNTFIAMEYDVYKDRSNPQIKEYSNIITVPNKLIAPKIVSVEGGKTMCPGESNGKITVKVDRSLLSQEIISFYAYTDETVFLRENIKIDPLTYEIINLPVGVYTVEVATSYNGVSVNGSDANNKRTGITVTDAEPVSYTVDAAGIRNISCKGGDDGSFKVIATGGTAPYTLWWEPDDTSGFISVQDNRLDVSGLKAGTYRYYVTDSNGCELFDSDIGGILYKSVNLIEPSESLAITFLPDKTAEPTGFGRSDGYINVRASGGIAPYTFEWQNKTTGEDLTTADNGTPGESRLYNIPAGAYTVTVTDSWGCVLFSPEGFTLGEPELLVASITRQGQILCNGDASVNLTASASGGVGNVYNYIWSKKVNDVYVDAGTGAELTGQGAGEYRVTVSDGSALPNIAEAYDTVFQPARMETSVIKLKNISCFGGNDGAINISVTGGIGGYKMYYKQNGVDTEYQLLPVTLPDNAFYLDNLTAGIYSLYIQDASGCTALIAGQEMAEIQLTEPEKALSIASVQLTPLTGAGRSDGSIFIVVDGGTPFDSGDKYLTSWKDENGNPVIPQNGVNAGGLFTSRISNLPKGVYEVEIKDKNYQDLSNACYLLTSIMLDEPLPLAVTVENTKTVNCFGENSGELVAHVSGGIPYAEDLPFQYTWYKVENAVETLLTNENDSILSDIPSGEYKVKVADGSSVTNYTESEIFTLSQPEKLFATVATRMISCFQGSDGYIHVSTTGGTGSCKLYYKQIGVDENYHEIDGTSANDSLEMNNIPAGIYSLYVLDENLCYATVNGTNFTEIELTQPDKALSLVSDTVLNPTGYGLSNGEIHVRVDGGTPGYVFIWKNEAGDVLPANDTVIDGVSASILTGLGEGKYSLEVRDANYPDADDANNTACFLTKEYELIQPEKLTVTPEETHYISCFEMSDAEITAHVHGGISPYKYTWYKVENSIETQLANENDSILKIIPAGIYKSAVEDFARIPNRTDALWQVVQPELLTATANEVHIVCGETATVSVTATGGTKPYTYRWNTGAETAEVSGMGAGKYMALVTDARGCEATAIAKVTTPSDLSVSATVNNPECYQSANGSIILTVTGGTAPYTCKWSSGDTTNDLLNIKAGKYTVTVTDSDGCSYSESFELTDPEPLKVNLGEDITLCVDQSYSLEPKVEDPATVFSWTGPDGFLSSSAKVEVNKAGSYSLTITNSKGCQATDNVQVFVNDYIISAEMAVATDMFVNDTIVLVNISSPEPDAIEWLFNEDDPIEVVETTPEMAEIIFSKTGDYTVGMRSFVKDCYRDVMKTLHVTENEGVDMDNFGQSDILKFVVYPNPNDGSFTTEIELERQSMLRLRLFSLSHGGIVDERILNGAKQYNEKYQMKITSGVYILLLESASGRRSEKVIIK